MATDNFTGTDGTVLSSYSANWSALASSELNEMRIKSNAVENNGGAGNRYSGRTWADDQYSQAVVVAVPDQHWGVCVRCGTGTTRTFYAGGSDFGNWGNNLYRIWKFVSGTRTQLWVHGSMSMTANDIVRLEVSGTTLVLKVNGADITGGGVTDSSISSGQAGIVGFHFAAPGTLTMLDDWEGDDLATNVTLALSGSSATGGHGTASPGISVGL